MTIPIQAQRIVSVPSLLFARWLPIKEDDMIVVEDAGLTLRLWCDMSCTSWSEKDATELPSCANVPVHAVKVEVQVKEVSDELAAFLVDSGRKASFPPESALKEQSIALGERVHQFALTYFNRLIAYARTNKGQYWLEEYPINAGRMSSDFAQFHAELKVDSLDWCRFRPTDRHHMKVILMDESRYVQEADWPQFTAFVKSKRRPSLVPQLLASAETLAGIDHRRAALVEAVAALEVAVAEFGRAPRADHAFGPTLGKRMRLESLESQIKHLGLSATIKYLFPVMFNEEQLPTAVLQGCQEAVEQRQNVVHNGQRDVSQEKLSVYLSTVRSACAILANYQEGIDE
jgi:hypothetical protein